MKKDGKEAIIEFITVGCVYDKPDMEDFFGVESIGTPSLTLKMPKPDTIAITCASTVNRI